MVLAKRKLELLAAYWQPTRSQTFANLLYPVTGTEN